MDKIIQTSNQQKSNEKPYPTLTGVPRTPVAMGGPVLDVDLPAEIEHLCQEWEWSRGRNAKTLVKHQDFRLVLTVMRAGTRINRHHVKGTVMIQVVSGHVAIRCLDDSIDAPAGHIISLDPQMPHDIEAVEDSSLLLSIAWPGDAPVAVRKAVEHPKMGEILPVGSHCEVVWN